MEEAFYVVWNPYRGPPHYRHASERQAVSEAERLAAANPGQKFYVLGAVCVSEHRTVVTTRLEQILPF